MVAPATLDRLPPEADRRFEAVILRWTGEASAEGSGLEALGRRIEEACARGLVVACVAPTPVDVVRAALKATGRGPGRLYIAAADELIRVGDSGPEPVSPRDGSGLGTDPALGRVILQFWRSGVSPGLALLVVDGDSGARRLPPLPGALTVAAASFAVILADQAERRRRRELPVADPSPAWTLTVTGIDADAERARATQLCLSDGRIGTSGSLPGSHPAAAPRVLAAGVYVGEGAESELLQCPIWTRLDGFIPRDPLLRRRLDMHAGLLHHELGLPDGLLHVVQLSSLARPGLVMMRAEGPVRSLAGEDGFGDVSGLPAESGTSGDAAWTTVRGTPGGVAAAVRDVRHRGGGGLERMAAYVTDPASPPSADAAVDALRDAGKVGFDGALAEHRATWARRWETADIAVEGAPRLQLAIRFALFHLMGAVGTGGDAAVGARGATGSAYRGHVFWDGDVFVLPFLAATHPPAARAMLDYRLRRLDTARAAARALRRGGARFPWESAHEGRDVTPRAIHDGPDRLIRIRTGEAEEHVVADVAWAAVFYADWTADRAFIDGPLVELLVETARYWASRARFDSDGRAHIFGVIGPDEYHEPVDDNAFTNVMARWNLERAIEHAGTAVPATEREDWRRTAAALVDGYDAATGVYEQFAGFRGLEPLRIADIAPRPIAADMLLGPRRVRNAQVVKQADVLMLHHLVPEAVAPGSLEPNLDFYEPRTAHGSSLSPAIHASLQARAGRHEQAAGSLRIAADIDLEDLTGTTGGGLHLATMGGLWQALVFGYGGIRMRDGVLQIAPRLPREWSRLKIRLQVRGTPVSVELAHDRVKVDADGPIAWELAE